MLSKSRYCVHYLIWVATYSSGIAIELGLDRYYLQTLETDHPTNCVLRCQKIFDKFLEKENATWGEIIHSIRTLNFNAIANDTENNYLVRIIMYMVIIQFN